MLFIDNFIMNIKNFFLKFPVPTGRSVVFPGSSISSTKKADRHNIDETPIVLKVKKKIHGGNNSKQ
jgi:hypothetical protein